MAVCTVPIAIFVVGINTVFAIVGTGAPSPTSVLHADGTPSNTIRLLAFARFFLGNPGHEFKTVFGRHIDEFERSITQPQTQQLFEFRICVEKGAERY